MREVEGTTWIFQLVIVFILIFACFLTLVLSYFKAYKVKNETLTIIEKYEGVTATSKDIINNYLYSNGYKTKGNCPENWYGVKEFTADPEKVTNEAEKYYYCFHEEAVNNDIYYNIRLFYRFNLPFLGEIMTFKIDGRTNNFIGSDEARWNE